MGLSKNRLSGLQPGTHGIRTGDTVFRVEGVNGPGPFIVGDIEVVLVGPSGTRFGIGWYRGRVVDDDGKPLPEFNHPDVRIVELGA